MVIKPKHVGTFYVNFNIHLKQLYSASAGK